MTKKRVLKDFKLTEISGVDRPAQPTALAAIMKNHDAVFEWLEVSSDNLPETIHDLHKSMTSEIEKISSDGGLSPEDKLATIALIKTDFSEEVSKVLSEDEIISVNKSLEEYNMSEIDDLKKALAEKTAELEKACADMAGMKAEEEKKKKAAEMAKNDETVVIAGQTVAKSAVGDGTFAIFKAQAEAIAKAEERIAKAEEAAELARLEKRAGDEFAHLPFAVTETAKLLKAVSGLDKAVVENIEKALKLADAANAESFKTIGKSKTTVESEDKLTKAVAEVKKSFPTLTPEQAFVKALELDPTLYTEETR